LIKLLTAGTVAVIVVAFCNVTFAAIFRLSLHLANVFFAPIAAQCTLTASGYLLPQIRIVQCVAAAIP
jgi:hypothetical protein